MIDEIINLRNTIHQGDFRLILTPEHWNISYVPEGLEKSNLAIVRSKDGRLRGYAAYYLVHFDHIQAYDIREICAEDRETQAQLIDQIVDKSVKDNVDFVFAKWFEDADKNVLAKRGFSSFSEAVIMVALFNPKELLSTLSEEIENGEVLKLLIKGFDPIFVKVGEKGIMVVNEEKPNLKVSTDSKTFLKLFFNRTSFPKEFFRKKVTTSDILNWQTANRFFKLIKQDKWHIPMGDWV